ncbi:hypothetical protein [Actinomadura sp. 7K534]|uniref:hypothetical protein n=1 Tax=Actinomadura sp. 7K534 TaxID=2530366 RepID=UPI00105001B9|nr:hypothetical protein [Actinomadura sp. 7K534]TDB94033.1 hypothetical protein E1266_18095 [Actinomadura sp. 7K534]
MSDHNGAGDLDRRTAERVLGGADDHARLHALLAAASAPARPGELAGEDAAVTAFKAARRSARTSRMAALRRLLTVKALVLVGGSLILTGGAAAYAAMNGHIPGRAPAAPASPTLDEQTSKGRHTDPAFHGNPLSEAPSSPPPSDSPTSGTQPPDSPHPGAPPSMQRPSASPEPPGDPGGESVPGRQGQRPTPAVPLPPRGSGNNATPPNPNSGKGGDKGTNGDPVDQNAANAEGGPA